MVVVSSTAVRPDNPEVVAGARAGHPGDPAGRDARRADAHEVRHRGGRRPRQDHHDLDGGGGAGARAGSTRPWWSAAGSSRIGRNARLGRGQFLVAEADESDGSFLRLSPAVAVVTNIDREHLDHYGALEEVQQAFVDFANRVPVLRRERWCAATTPTCAVLLPQHDQAARAPTARRPTRTLRAADVRVRPRRARASACVGVARRAAGTVRLPAARAAQRAERAGGARGGPRARGRPSTSRVTRSRGSTASGRRFETRGEAGGVLVVDDYGAPSDRDGRHAGRGARGLRPPARGGLPAAPLLAHAAPGARVRRGASKDADLVVLADIYAAGERPMPGVSADHRRQRRVPGSDAAASSSRRRRRRGGDGLADGAARATWC